MSDPSSSRLENAVLDLVHSLEEPQPYVPEICGKLSRLSADFGDSSPLHLVLLKRGDDDFLEVVVDGGWRRLVKQGRTPGGLMTAEFTPELRSDLAKCLSNWLANRLKNQS